MTAAQVPTAPQSASCAAPGGARPPGLIPPQAGGVEQVPALPPPSCPGCSWCRTHFATDLATCPTCAHVLCCPAHWQHSHAVGDLLCLLREAPLELVEALTAPNPYRSNAHCGSGHVTDPARDLVRRLADSLAATAGPGVKPEQRCWCPNGACHDLDAPAGGWPDCASATEALADARRFLAQESP